MQVDISESLRSCGYKVTPQRLAVYEALSSTYEHPNAEMLFTQLQPKYPMMSLATVYKTLDILEKIDKIKVLNTGEDSFRYDADTTEHHHVQCKICGRVDDVREAVDGPTIKRFEKKTGYTIEDQQVYLFGTCPKCKS